MTFLHTADWHLGYRQYGMAVREADFLKPLDEIADVAIRNKVSAVVVAGDIFDNYRPPASAVQAAREFGRKMSEAGITVLSIDGNHDLTNGRWARLCGFIPLEQDTPESEPCIDIDGVRFAGIDFCHTQKLIEKLKALQEKKLDLKGGVLVLHMEIAELTAYSTALSLRDLEPYLDALNVGYVALGHIHNTVSTAVDSGRKYSYPGSTEMNDISELGLKSVDIVFAEPGGRYSRDQLVLATRKFEVIDIDSQEALDDKLVTSFSIDPDTFWLVKVNLSAPGELITRVEEIMKDRLYRILPYGSKTIEEQVGKATVVIGLKDAISKFFPPDSDQAALTSRIIDTPEQVKAILDEYVHETKDANNANNANNKQQNEGEAQDGQH